MQILQKICGVFDIAHKVNIAHVELFGQYLKPVQFRACAANLEFDAPEKFWIDYTNLRGNPDEAVESLVGMQTAQAAYFDGALPRPGPACGIAGRHMEQWPDADSAAADSELVDGKFPDVFRIRNPMATEVFCARQQKPVNRFQESTVLPTDNRYAKRLSRELAVKGSAGQGGPDEIGRFPPQTLDQPEKRCRNIPCSLAENCVFDSGSIQPGAGFTVLQHQSVNLHLVTAMAHQFHQPGDR